MKEPKAGLWSLGTWHLQEPFQGSVSALMTVKLGKNVQQAVNPAVCQANHLLPLDRCLPGHQQTPSVSRLPPSVCSHWLVEVSLCSFRPMVCIQLQNGDDPLLPELWVALLLHQDSQTCQSTFLHTHDLTILGPCPCVT